jgi:hypothetical protein
MSQKAIIHYNAESSDYQTEIFERCTTDMIQENNNFGGEISYTKRTRFSFFIACICKKYLKTEINKKLSKKKPHE